MRGFINRFRFFLSSNYITPKFGPSPNTRITSSRRIIGKHLKMQASKKPTAKACMVSKTKRPVCKKEAVTGKKGVTGKKVGATGKKGGAIGKEEGAIGKEEGAFGKMEGATGKKEEATVKKGGAIGKEEGTIGKKEEAMGKEEGAIGKEEGAIGKKEEAMGKEVGAIGKEEGATGKEEGEDLPFDFETAFLQAQFKHLFATISNVSDDKDATVKNEDAVKAKTMAPSRPSSNLAAFREEFARAKHIVVLTGAGVSAESGVPTFRGAGGFWRKWQAQDLASPEAFRENPSLVWEFYHHRREVMATKSPNPAHKAIAETEKRLATQGRKVVVITQNIDELHKAAGSQDITELHGSLFRVRCTKCSEVTVNRDSPICPALGGKGEPNPEAKDAKIPVEQLPKCQKEGCGGLLRPDVIWFGESLNREVLDRAFKEIAICDLCLVVGTSSVVYPAAMFAPSAAERGVPVAEFNIEATAATDQFGYMFEGPAGEWLPKALAPHPSEKK